MPELVTMRITVDPVLKEQLKVRAIERGMTQAELLPKLLAQGLRSEPNEADAVPTTMKSGQVPEEPAAKNKDAPPPGPSVQETVTRLLADHSARVASALGEIAAREERIEQLCSQQQGRFDQAVESIGKRAQQAVERSNAQWRGVMCARVQNRYWLGATVLATLIAIWILLALISGTSLGRRLAVWQAGADNEWQAARSLASHGSYLHSELMGETAAFLDNPEFRSSYAKCVGRTKVAKSSVRCTLLFPAITVRP